MSTWDDRTLVEDLLARGVDDWISAAEVYDVALRSGVSDPATLRALSVGLIAETLTRGWMVAGDLTDSGFTPWDRSPAETTAAVAADWFEREQPVVRPGEVVWLDNTDRGQELGLRILEREREWWERTHSS